MKNFCCTICSSNNGKEIFTFKNYPAYLVPLPTSIALDVAKADLTLCVCNHCGHMQTPNPVDSIQKLIYEVYYSYYVVDTSEAFIPHYRIPFINFIEKMKKEGLLPNGDLLEIGCSSGEKVDFFSSFSKSYTGIDPSDRILLAIEKYPELNFIQGYFPQALSDKQFDVIVTQFNLEHINNVNQFIQHINDLSRNDGVILVQVPNCTYFLKTNQPNFLAHEHIQYFTRDSLSYLLEKNGFKPIAWGEDGPSLITAAIKSIPSAKVNEASAVINIKNAEKQAELLAAKPDLPLKPIIFYGVGPQLYWLLNEYKVKVDDISVVDDNPNYINQGLPGYNIIIDAISANLIKEKNTIVLSLNKIYHSVIIDKIKSFHIPCTIIYLKNSTWVELKLLFS